MKDIKIAVRDELDLSGKDLRSMNLRGADLHGAKFIGTNLSGVDLRNSNLKGANMREADLRNALLNHADMRNTNLSLAKLYNANLHGTDLRNAIIIDTDIGTYTIITRRPLLLRFEHWEVTIWDKYMMIGCKLLPLSTWFGLNDEEIYKFSSDDNTHQDWLRWKDVLHAICEAGDFFHSEKIRSEPTKRAIKINLALAGERE